MFRFLIFLAGMLTTSRGGGMKAVPYRAESGYDDADGYRDVDGYRDAEWHVADDPRPRYAEPRYAEPRYGGGRRRRIPRWIKWAAAAVVISLIFRKVIAWAALVALSAAFHIVGVNVHLPHVRLAWPWQTVSAGTTTNVDLGPWVLQKIEGISRPALGTENFTFTFTHKVSKNIGIWPCWYSSTFEAAGHTSATVDLNPGSTWWASGSGHYELQVLSRPLPGKPGRVSVTMVLPQPQLPQSVHDVTIDNTLSHPIDTQHSWTYPGFGCGGLIKPQFSPSVLYGLAQSIAFTRVRTNPQITQPLINKAEAQASQIIRYNFVQPTVNALGYTLTDFSLRWSEAT